MASELEFLGDARDLPVGAVTGVGSLPHTNATAAVEFVARHAPQLPFWPQLPQSGAAEDGIVQTLSPLMHLLHRRSPAHIDLLPGKLAAFLTLLQSSDVSLPREHAAGLYALEEAARAGRFPNAKAYKGHLYGPITLARCLYLDGRPIADGGQVQVATVYQLLGEYLVRMARWQVQKLAALGLPVLLVIDEPALALERPDSIAMEALRRVVDEVRLAGAIPGVHCCALPTPQSVFAAQPDVISFDAYQGMEQLLASPEARAFVERGGWFAWGIVPTLQNLGNMAADELFAHWMGVLSRRNLDSGDVLRNSLVTATCGLGLLNETAAEANFTVASRLAELLMNARKQASLQSAVERYRLLSHAGK